MISHYIVDCEYKGKRLFKWNQATKRVLQVVVIRGSKRSNAIGIYHIEEVSFKGNYFWLDNKCLRTTTKKLFDYWFNVVLNQLK